jgi:hypothetical protein
VRFPQLRADALVRELDLDLNAAGICHACLSFVSFALDDGDPSEISRQIRHMTPILWIDGLAEPTPCDAPATEVSSMRRQR